MGVARFATSTAPQQRATRRPRLVTERAAVASFLRGSSVVGGRPPSLQGQDLRGRSLRRRQLAGADLRGADLRGADLSGADLRGADLREARTGAGLAWATTVVGGALALSVATGLLSGLGGRYLTQLWQSDAMIDQVLSVFVTSALVVLVLASVVVGLGRTLRTVVPVLAATLAVAWIVTVLSGLGTGHMALAALAWVMAVAVVVILALAARALAGGVRALAFMLVAVSGALSGALLGGGVAATIVAIGTVIAAQRSLRGAPGYTRLARLVAAINARGGTSFQDADLSNARLEDTTLQACDLRGARLDGAHLDGARLRACRFDGEPPHIPRARMSLADRADALAARLPWHPVERAP